MDGPKPIKFTLPEVFALMRRNRALEKENAQLRKSLDSVRTEVKILREQYSDIARRGKVVMLDKTDRLL